MDKLRSAFADVENGRLALVQLDVTDKAQAEKAISAAVSRFDRLDVVVNNAGLAVLGFFEAAGIVNLAHAKAKLAQLCRFLPPRRFP
jgi:NADP-dependent 3-hydroxy acid dehydrogenase YdfG